MTNLLVDNYILHSCMPVIGFVHFLHAAFTHGKKFAIGFMSNINPDEESDFLATFLTTASNMSVSVTIKSSEGTLNEVVPVDDFTKIGDYPQSLEVIASDYSNRHKGVLIEVTGEGTISVLVQNLLPNLFILMHVERFFW